LWQPTLQEFKELFNNEYILDIMVILNKKDDKSITPTELSDLLKIHVTTAKKYLELLVKYNFATNEILLNKLGRPTVYTLQTKVIDIRLSLEKDSYFDDIDVEVWNPAIREAKNVDQFASYIFINDLVTEIKIKSKTKAKRYVTLTLELTKNEQLFMKNIPLPTMDPKPLIKICNNAKINSIIEIKALESFVKKLEKYQIIELY
jgi:hypothetical protein